MSRSIYLRATIIAILLLLVTTAGNTEEKEAPYPEIIRLHIMANSNAEKDQELKLMVRDKILTELNLAEIKDYQESWHYLEHNLETIQELCAQLIQEQGYSYEVQAYLTTEEFPAREYGSQFYPPGEYQALKIVIGKGQGANWWCVLYPPLCHEALFNEDEAEKQATQVNVSVSPREVKEKTELGEILELFFQIVKKTWLI